MTLRAIVLGAAAGGGFPQWNCRCAGCLLSRAGDARARARTQASVAVSGNDTDWILVNASPDLIAQIHATPVLQPKEGMRGSPITAVVLTGGEVDQVTGLLSLRERHIFTIIGTERVLDTVGANPIFAALDPNTVCREAVAFDRPFTLPGGVDGRLFAAPGKVPLYLENAAAGNPEEFTAGVELKKDGRSIVIIPGAASLPPALQRLATESDLLFFDGTLFTDDEMIRAGTGTKTGRRMGHMPISGDGGSLTAFKPGAKRVYLHINNTNPILIDGSPEYETVRASGWDVAYDGMEFVL
jgi:pyrroloquinoline quinone biosynthesis protein B